MIRNLLAAAAIVASTQAFAGDLDVKDVLHQLRECSGWRGCEYAKDDIWAAVHDDGETVIFYKPGGLFATIDIRAHGNTLQEAVQNLASQLNDTRAQAAGALKAIGPLLPSQ